MSFSTQEDANGKKRKPYTHMACTCCKAKHIKCDGGKPACSYCTSKKLDCHYREERNIRRSNSKSQLKEEELKDQLVSLQKEVEQWKIRYYTLFERVQLHQTLGTPLDPFVHNHLLPSAPLPTNPTKQSSASIKSRQFPNSGNHHSFEVYSDTNMDNKAPFPERHKSYSFGDLPPGYPQPAVLHNHSANNNNFIAPPPNSMTNSRLTKSQSLYEGNFMAVDTNYYQTEENRSLSVPHSMPLIPSYQFTKPQPVGMRNTSESSLERIVDSPYQENNMNMVHKSQDMSYANFSLLVDAKPVYMHNGRMDGGNFVDDPNIQNHNNNEYNIYGSPHGYMYRDYQGGEGFLTPSSV